MRKRRRTAYRTPVCAPRVARAEVREKQRGARRAILEAANAALLDKDKTPVLRVRHIQEAVCICRRRLLVPAEVFEAAGFNAHA